MKRSSFRSNPQLVAGFDQVVPEKEANEIFVPLIRWHLDQLSQAGWVEGIYAADCLARGDLRALYNWDPDVLDLAAADAYHLGQCRAFFSKRRDIDLGVDRRAAAVAKFRDTERACALTNSAFLAHSQGRFEFRPCVSTVLYRAKQKICDVLGDAPTLAEVRPRFGPGATTQTPKKNACLGVKLDGVPACAANSVHLASELLEAWDVSSIDTPGHCALAYEGGSTLHVEIHASSIEFVPKTAKTLRAICKEPVLNSFYQNGVGDFMADLLRLKAGIDIRDQSRNQRGALYGSIHGRTATIDLSSASDTVAWRLVQHLLPQDWFDLLYSLSTRITVIEGEVVTLEKISTMGNGFTFPLETLIFWALAQSANDLVDGGKALAYGDDLIVSSKAVPLLLQVLHDSGFTANPSKSFWTGSFRESCGKDYVSGTDVRPCFVKGDTVEGAKRTDWPDALHGMDFFTLHNFYVRRGLNVCAAIVESFITPAIRTRGPDGYGDGHLIGLHIPKLALGHGCIGYRFETWSFSPRNLCENTNFGYARSSRIKIRETGSSVTALMYGTGRSHALHVMRIATYTIYQRELVDRSDRLMPDPVVRSDTDYWVTPGKGPLRRTSVYTFEPVTA